ncbi:MAG: NADH-quinone oxidoreductase subunit NuoF [Peptococcaceae bacterium]|jgi:NADP-reducing hydrogenase subunit HndC|nr:NADH-quinone oxidoreductase subunit NuoF [Peptococcaceae bacterium]MBQ2013842.1 NADH-quinone oxidoreductase subunit NuoF [Peptococcaceae bacterium]MBQ2014365.1 NADH-quinone oxidoreductase subunit NuoF [Peptococcaceae bacterium]MBQ2035499.1 NADH-quinone oxidoreductase subunit NuoF [Peptococcaceae bacterium]MBQ2120157.1 NADH-quinone oxidoreductase subunit NuoF [Peptococcaceae bacterium]
MNKITSFEELKALQAAERAKIAVRDGQAPGAANLARHHVMICAGTGCSSSNSMLVKEALEKQLVETGLDKEIDVVQTGCFGFCSLGPIMVVYPEGTFYHHVKVEDVAEIVETHLKGGQLVERLLYDIPGQNKKAPDMSHIPFFQKQKRVALRNCGTIDPENIGEAIAHGAYQGLGKALTEMTPADAIAEVEKSGIRGRGGAGFPTGKKWKFAAGYQSPEKYVVVNADEGDPGAFMDRSVLEGDPHSILEAMAIGGYAIGATHGFIYVRAEYPIAVHRLEIAIAQAREAGLLGKNIMGTGFDFDIDIRLGAGAFVCGEETALLTSVEGKRGEPRPRPPFPAEKGLWGVPTFVNNVETLANIPVIFTEGGEAFASVGTAGSKGTKVFAMAGKVNNIGLVEVPMGTTLREMIYDIGGGIPNGKAFKAAQTGGPSGGCLPADALDTEIDFDTLVAAGSMMGSGGLIVLDETTCMVDIAKFYLEFTQDESCGKCPPCRIGTKRMLEILDKITRGEGTMEDIDNLETLARTISSSALCALGQTAPNPILATLKFFREEYEAHIIDKKCPAGVCKKLLQYQIDADKCKGCTACARNCPVGAIEGAVREPHRIDTAKCIKCGSCIEKCRFGAISRG